MNKVNKNYGVIVVGAGPAGTTAAMFAKKQGLSVMLVDKATFPREKICGDGLSTRTMKTLQALGLYEKFLEKCPVNKIDGVTFSSPNGTLLPINYAAMGRYDDVEGYTLDRTYFDNFLFNEAKNLGIDIIENFEVKKILTDKNENVCGISGNKDNETLSFEAKIVVCATGIFPKILKSINYEFPSQNKYAIGIRQHFKGVDCNKKMIEMHFVKEIVQGYFWIFPEKNNLVNLGFVIPEKIRKCKKINLEKELERIISSPQFSDRFKNAEKVTEPKAAFLNLGGSKVYKPKAGLLIIGDSMGLTEHFTGEGVGNAMFSGQKAADVIKTAFETNDFSEKTMVLFHKNCVYALLKEFRVSAIVNKMKFVWLINFVIGIAAKNSETMMNVAKAVASQKDRKKLLNPMFYIKLLFKK